MDGLPCSGQTSELLHIFLLRQTPNFSCYVELNFLLIRRTQLFLLYSIQLFLIHQVLLCGVVRWTQFFYSTLQRVYLIVLDTSSSILQRVSSILLLNFVSESALLRQRVSLILQRVCSTQPRACSTLSAGTFILHAPWRVPLFCSLHSVQERPLYPVLRVLSLLYNVDSGRCITLQLWNPVSHSNPVFMHCLTFWNE